METPHQRSEQLLEQRSEHRLSIGANEAAFIASARKDDTAGFAVLTERFRRELLAHCYRMLASYDDAHDLTQETFLRAWARRESFQGRASLRTWLFRIATNTCLDFLEKRRDRTPIPADLQGAGGTGTEVLYFPGFALGHRLIPERGRWSLASAVLRWLRDACR